MPPYENQSLHEMHALLQQFDTLNAAHGPEYCEGRFQDAGKAIIAKAKAAKEAAAAAAAATKAVVKGAADAHKQHNEEVKTQKDKDAAVQDKWTKMVDSEKKEVLKRSVDLIDTSAWTETFFNNPKMKEILQKCIQEYTPKEVKK